MPDHCPSRSIQGPESSRGPVDYSETAKSQTGFSNRTKGQTGSTNWQMTVTLRSAGSEAPWWALLGVALTLCWLLPHQLPEQQREERRQGGGSGRLTFLLSSGRLVPLVENTTFLLQLQVPLSLKEAPHAAPGSVCVTRARAGRPALGSPATCPAGNPSSKTRRPTSGRGALALQILGTGKRTLA